MPGQIPVAQQEQGSDKDKGSNTGKHGKRDYVQRIIVHMSDNCIPMRVAFNKITGSFLMRRLYMLKR